MTNKELSIYTKELQNYIHKCKCGHSVLIRAYEVKSICNWCGRSVYRNEKEEFKDRLGVKLYGRNFKRKDL